jgi:Transmembrane secretion effector
MQRRLLLQEAMNICFSGGHQKQGCGSSQVQKQQARLWYGRSRGWAGDSISPLFETSILAINGTSESNSVMVVLSALKNRGFAFLWLGQTLSVLGDNVFRIALSIWLVRETGSGQVLAVVMVFSLAPMLMFLLFGGIVADRVSRVRVMVVSDVSRGLVIGTLWLLAATGKLEIWMVCLANVLLGAASAFFQPAYSSLFPELVSNELLNTATSLTVISGQVAAILGPLLAAVITRVGDGSAVFEIDCLSFFFAAICAVPVLIKKSPREVCARNGRVLTELSEGVSAVLETPWLCTSIVLFAITNATLAGPLSVALPLLIGAVGPDVSALGVLYAAMATGSIAAGLAVSRFRRFRFRGPTIYLALLANGALILVMGLHVSFTVLAIAMFVVGGMYSLSNLVWYNTLYEFVPAEKLGRVSSIDYFGTFVLLPLGYSVSGVLTDRLSPANVFILGGTSTMIFVALGLARPYVRRLD